MANRYGEAALLAVRLETHGKPLSCAERWSEAVGNVYPASAIAQGKTAPRSAFLGLCQAGLIVGIASSPAAKENVHGTYAVRAVEMLRAGSHRTVSELWTAVTEGKSVPHASQMDVVLALWKNGLLSGSK